MRRFTEEIDLIIDNKKFDVPTTPAARAYQAKQNMHSQLRTPSEGLRKDFTKPRTGKQRRNLGGKLNVCAGLSGGRVVLWEYYKKWNAQVAVDMYKGPLMQALIEHRGVKTSYLLAEDNDPTGYKSGLAMAEKRRLGLRTIQWPRYSPDLMPLDFCLWSDISKRAAAEAPMGQGDRGGVQPTAEAGCAQHSPGYSPGRCGRDEEEGTPDLGGGWQGHRQGLRPNQGT